MVDTPRYLDRALCNVFAVTLRNSDANQGADPPVIYLQGLSEVTMYTSLLRTANYAGREWQVCGRLCRNCRLRTNL